MNNKIQNYIWVDDKIIDQRKRVNNLMVKNPVFYNTATRLDIMVYQLGEAVKFLKIYAPVYKGTLDAGYIAEGNLSLCNLMIQTELLCVANGWNLDEIRHVGYEHLLIKMKEVHEKGGKII